MSSSTTTEKKKITLKSSDGADFEVEEACILLSQTIKHIIDDGRAEDTIPVPNVTSNILAKVIEYCHKHAHAEEEAKVDDKSDDILNSWDMEFAKIDDHSVLLDLLLAAKYLDIKGLLDLLCDTVANMMKGKSPEEIREIFQIENDFTPEEEAAIRSENSWVFE